MILAHFHGFIDRSTLPPNVAFFGQVINYASNPATHLDHHFDCWLLVRRGTDARGGHATPSPAQPVRQPASQSFTLTLNPNNSNNPNPQQDKAPLPCGSVESAAVTMEGKTAIAAKALAHPLDIDYLGAWGGRYMIEVYMFVCVRVWFVVWGVSMQCPGLDPDHHHHNI